MSMINNGRLWGDLNTRSARVPQRFMNRMEILARAERVCMPQWIKSHSACDMVWRSECLKWTFLPLELESMPVTQPCNYDVGYMCYSGHFSLEQGNALNETQFVIFLLAFEYTTIDETGRLLWLLKMPKHFSMQDQDLVLKQHSY